MDTNSMEASVTTKSTEFLTKSQRKNRRKKAKKDRERKQRADLELKNLQAPRSEESSVEDVASLKKSEFDLDSTAQLLPVGHPEIEKDSVKGLLEKNTVGKRRRKKRRINLEAPRNEESSVEDVASLKKSELDVDSTAQLLPLGHPETEEDSVKGLPEKNTVGKRRRKKRKINLEAPRNEESSVEDVASLKKSELDVDSTTQLLPLGHPEVEKDSLKGRRKKSTEGIKGTKRKRGKALNNNADPSSMGQNDNLSKPGLSDNKLGEVENVSLNLNISARDSGSSERKATETLRMADVGIPLSVPSSDLVNELEEPEQLNHGNVALPPIVLDNPTHSVAAELLEEGHKSSTGVCKREVNTDAEVTKHDSNAVQAKKDNVKGTNDRRDNVKGSNNNVRLASLSPGIRLRRKLLILDVNGLLADIVHPPPKDCKPDACLYRRAIFRRPYYHAFMKFCFKRFDVAIWSSRSKKIIVKVVDYLLGGLKDKLLFCWDMSHSTQTKFKTLDNKYKPLVCKELSKVWDRYDPSLPWERGVYDESNTLLLDDSPYKALLNPAHTAIFPPTYNYKAENDNSLGPGGDLRIYLEEIYKAEHVQKYVEQHPFGQQAIDETSSDWKFYSEVLGSLHGQSG